MSTKYKIISFGIKPTRSLTLVPVGRLMSIHVKTMAMVTCLAKGRQTYIPFWSHTKIISIDSCCTNGMFPFLLGKYKYVRPYCLSGSEEQRWPSG